MNVDPSTFYIFDVGRDSEVDLSPIDASTGKSKNAPVFNAFISH